MDDKSDELLARIVGLEQTITALAIAIMKAMPPLRVTILHSLDESMKAARLLNAPPETVETIQGLREAIAEGSNSA